MREDILQKIALFESEGKFDQAVENEPPKKELKPNEVDYLNERFSSRIKTRWANFVGDRYFLGLIKKGVMIIDDVVGVEHLSALEKGAVVTANHFSPMDNYIVFHALRKYLPRTYLYKVVKESNYTSVKGLYGLLMRHCNTLPLSSNRRTMINFTTAVNVLLKRGEAVLIYPEQEMWWNYKKPRPFKIGGFKLACRAGVPVLPVFITMVEDEKLKDEYGYPRMRHTVHILPPVYPDFSFSGQAVAEDMKERCFALYKQKYEEVYKLPLEYGKKRV